MKQAYRPQADYDEAISPLKARSLKGAKRTGATLHQGAFFVGQRAELLHTKPDIQGRDTDIFAEAAGVDIGILKLPTGGKIAVAAEMTLKTGDMMADADSLAYFKTFNPAANFNYISGYFMAEDSAGRDPPLYNFTYISAAEAAGPDF